MHVYERAVDSVVDTKKNEAIGQFDLFGFGTEDESPLICDVFVAPVRSIE